jgi:hypothetical protein
MENLVRRGPGPDSCHKPLDAQCTERMRNGGQDPSSLLSSTTPLHYRDLHLPLRCPPQPRYHSKSLCSDLSHCLPMPLICRTYQKPHSGCVSQRPLLPSLQASFPFFAAVLGFELRAMHLLGRFSAPSIPLAHLALVIFLDRV